MVWDVLMKARMAIRGEMVLELENRTPIMTATYIKRELGGLVIPT
jgi:hypothetical protein